MNQSSGNSRKPSYYGRSRRLMYVLKKYGYKIAILSGGFTYFGQYLQKKYGIDYVYANELEIVDGKLTGRIWET